MTQELNTNFVIPTGAERSERSGGTCFRSQLHRTSRLSVLLISGGH